MEGVRSAQVQTELGEITLVANGESLTGLYFPGHWHLPAESAFGRPIDAAHDPLFTETLRQLNDYLSGTRTSFELPLATEGDKFSEQVWAMLTEIPYGQRTTYGSLAERLGNKKLAQRVGQAVGRNPISIVIPCHRVVGADGSLTGYAGGFQRKRFLLDLEEPAELAQSRLF